MKFGAINFPRVIWMVLRCTLELFDGQREERLPILALWKLKYIRRINKKNRE
jgi:hypothetical protein